MSMQFILNNIIVPFTSSFFTVVGGAMPIAVLIHWFSMEEKIRLLANAKQIKDALPLLEKLYLEISELYSKPVNRENLSANIDQFNQLIEAGTKIEEHKKFIKYAEDYNFLSAVGQILRMSSYMPKNMNEHREISKDLPSSYSK